MTGDGSAGTSADSSCPGCGLAAPDTGEDPPPEYRASAACYRLYGEVLARDYSDPAYYRVGHQMVVDAYAAQHAGGRAAARCRPSRCA